MASRINITFKELIKEEDSICIPQIQRDYAQGRKNSKVDTIRTDFLKSLLKVVCSDIVEKPLRLDFVYGYNRNDSFEPLDGQQRLTTLFLLHWVFLPEGCNDLVSSKHQTVLSYATRKSSESFCRELVHPKHQAFGLFKKWEAIETAAAQKFLEQKKTELIEELKKDYPEQTEFNINEEKLEKYSRKPFSEYILSRDWFKWSWRYDPTIISMLNVMDALLELFPVMGIEYTQDKLQMYYDRLDNITFDKRNLEDLQQGDTLYVKMNARGKELSDFDKLKSSLEEEMQQQGLSGQQIENNWKSCMDGKWLNYFWYKIKDTVDTSPNTENKTANIAFGAEMNLLRLLLRLISIQYHDVSANAYDNDFERLKYEAGHSEFNDFLNTCFSTGYKIDELFHKYSNIAWWMRQKSINFKVIDFKQVFNDMEALLYKDDNGIWHDVTEIGVQNWDGGSSSCDYISDISSRQKLVMFYAILSFVRRIPAYNIIKDAHLKEDFKYWVRFIRDIVYPANTYSRVDDIEATIKAFATIDTWLNEYEKDTSLFSKMCSFISTIDPDKTNFGEKARIEEERLKAKLRLEPQEWDSVLESYETHTYFTGQTGQILESWSKDEDGNYNIDLFKDYTDRIIKFFDFGCSNQNDLMAERALLAVRDYREDTYGNCLGWFNTDKSRSFKQYLRTSANRIVRDLLEIWKSKEYAENNDFCSFASAFVDKSVFSPNDWRRWAVKYSDVLWYGWRVVINRDVPQAKGEYTFLAQKLTAGSNMMEVFLYYLKKYVECLEIENFSCELQDYRMMEWGQGEHILILRDGENDVVEIGLAGNHSYFLEDKLNPSNSISSGNDVDVEKSLSTIIRYYLESR